MNIPATKEEILENFKENSNGRPLNKDDYEIAEALSRITYKAYEVGMEDAKQLNMEDMMDNKNSIQVFNNSKLGKVRVSIINGAPWFVLKDVCNILGVSNSRMVADRLDDDEKGVSQIDTLGGKQKVLVINESGLYHVVLRSDKPQAKPFRKWVTNEVLPTLRKTGSYNMNPQENKPNTQDNAILQVLMKNTEVLQAIVQQNQQIMIALTNLSVNDAKRTMEIQPYTSHQGQKGDGKRSKRITILMSDSERTFVTREARKHGFTAGEYIYNLSVAASKDQIDLG